MAILEDESIFWGIIEFDAPDGNRYRYDQKTKGLHQRVTNEFGQDSYPHIAHLPLKTNATPGRIWGAYQNLDD